MIDNYNTLWLRLLHFHYEIISCLHKAHEVHKEIIFYAVVHNEIQFIQILGNFKRFS